MNYRHAFHAGNHADVLKHAVLARVAAYLAQKDKPFAALDVHAGLGAYDLKGTEAAKTGEWQTGIGLMAEPFADEVEAILKLYRQAVAALNPQGDLRFYPGSPEILLQAMRGGDRLIANELHPADAKLLRQNYAGEGRLEVTELDALTAVKSKLPFKERRGLVLIDPPYEEKNETEKVARMLVEGQKRFASGTFVIWYPVTTEKFADEFITGLQATGIANMLMAELRIKHTHEDAGLSGSGLVILNPPFTLEEELKLLLPALAQRLGVAGLGRHALMWITPKKD